MNGIRCAYLRATEPEHAERRGHGVASAFDRQLHDVLGVEVDRVRRERRAGGVLDALIDRQDRHVAGAGQPAVVEERLQAAHHPGRPVGQRDDPVHEVGPRKVKAVFRDGLALMRKERTLITKDRLDALDSGARRAACYTHVATPRRTILRTSDAFQGNSKSSTAASQTARATNSSIGRLSSPASISTNFARVIGLRGVNSVQQSWSGMIEIG